MFFFEQIKYSFYCQMIKVLTIVPYKLKPTVSAQVGTCFALEMRR
jgi:hypothetical protein